MVWLLSGDSGSRHYGPGRFQHGRSPIARFSASSLRACLRRVG